MVGSINRCRVGIKIVPIFKVKVYLRLLEGCQFRGIQLFNSNGKFSFGHEKQKVQNKQKRAVQ